MDFAALLGAMGRGQGGPPAEDKPLRDTSEIVHISSLALLKMLIHGRAGVPLEVMGIMLGELTDEYTVRVVDVFSIPYTATGQSVEAVDDAFQSEFVNMMHLVGRPENLVGWYHSHPGLGCWLSGADVETAGSYEKLEERSVSVVVDPVQSVRGKVVIDAFRCIPQHMAMTRQEPRQTTSNVGLLNRATGVALMHGLNRAFYNMPVTFRKKEHENAMLMNVHKQDWRHNMKLSRPRDHIKDMRDGIKKVGSFAQQATKFIQGGQDEDDVANVGHINPLAHLQLEADSLLTQNLDQSIGAMINALVF